LAEAANVADWFKRDESFLCLLRIGGIANLLLLVFVSKITLH
jgi:hypothetical protein